MPQFKSRESDNELNANIRSLNAKQKQVTKETVKQKGSVAPNVIKRLYLFLSGLGGVGKSHE